MVDCVVKDLLLGLLLLDWLHGQSICRADVDAVGATGTVELRNCNLKLVALSLRTNGILELRLCWCSSNLFVGKDEWTNDCVWADISALVTLNALLDVPLRNNNSNAALLVSSSTKLKLAINVVLKCRNRKCVTLHTRDWSHDVANLLEQSLTALKGDCAWSILCSSPISRNLNLSKCSSTSVDCLVVHIDDVLALLQVRMSCSVLHVLKCVCLWENLCKSKECRLKNGVGALAHTNFLGKVNCINQINVDVVLSNVALCLCWQVVCKLLCIPLAVDQEGTARLDVADHLVALDDVCRNVACNKVCLGDIVRRTDLVITEAQVADGDTAGLLGVILEVCLNIFIGVVTNNLNGVLISTNGTVAADTPELALNGTLSCSVRCLRILWERQVGNVIDNTNSELTLRSIFLELLEDCKCR